MVRNRIGNNATGRGMRLVTGRGMKRVNVGGIKIKLGEDEHVNLERDEVRKIRLITAVMVEMKLERRRMITWRGGE
jgi:hypothetical protein